MIIDCWRVIRVRWLRQALQVIHHRDSLIALYSLVAVHAATLQAKLECLLL